MPVKSTVKIPAEHGNPYQLRTHNETIRLSRKSSAGRQHEISLGHADAVAVCDGIIDLLETMKETNEQT